MHAVLESIATGNPPYSRSQSEAAEFMQKIESLPEGLRRRLAGVYGQSGIERRYSCVPDYARDDPSDFEFFGQNWSLEPAPSTAERNAWYRKAVLPLAETVAREALEDAELAPEEVTHVIAVSCTGFFAPGIDIELVRRLGLPRDTQRTMIGFMGCYAAFNALRVARQACLSQDNARVLIVCAELCTLHFQIEDSLEMAVINALFSDGAAAAIVTSRGEEEARGQLTVADMHCLMDEDSVGHMTWDVGDAGFLMGLSPQVPSVIARCLEPYLDALLGRNELTNDDVDFWAIHPGGRSIVEKAQDVLDLSDEAVRDSLEVLRLHGNMSSPTILFVLKRFLDRFQKEANGRQGIERKTGVALAFGPGLTLEGCLLRGA